MLNNECEKNSMNMNKMRKTAVSLFLVGLVALMLLNACSDNPVALENNLDNPLVGKDVIDTTLYAIMDTTYMISSKLNNQFSKRLAIGIYKGFEARPILRFTKNLPDGAIFTSARIQFKSDGFLSDGNPAAFTATAFPVQSVWISNLDSVWSDYTQNFDNTNPLGEIEINPSQSDTFSLKLNAAGLEFLSVWADTNRADENGGMILDFSQANYLQYLTSINVDVDPTSVVEPMLIFDYHTASDPATQTDTTSATFDAYVYSVEIPVLPERDYVSSQVNYSTLLKFDLEGLLAKYPQGIDIVSANLQLPVDRQNSLFDAENPLEMSVQKLLSDIDSKSVKVDSSFQYVMNFSQWSADSSYMEIVSGDERQRFARFVIQSQLGGLLTSSGLVVDFNDKSTSYSYVAFYKRETVNKELAPRLVLTFRIAPSSRF